MGGSKHDQSPRRDTLPQLTKPPLRLSQAIQKLKHNQVKVFNLIRNPGQLLEKIEFRLIPSLALRCPALKAIR